jgi:drug/metabolite transporter (DMT)-like permease
MTGRRKPVPRSVVQGLVLAIALDTVAQVMWKAAAAGPPLASPYFYATLLAIAAQLVNWLRVLSRADLSFAQPITALSYVTVLAISARFLHEDLPPSRLAGVGLILAGVWLVSRTPAETADGAAP